MTRDQKIELAKKAGYGTQIHVVGDTYTTEIWGGWFETQKVFNLIDLAMKESKNDQDPQR